MTINLETLAVKLTADASQFSGELNKAQSKTSKFAQGVTSGLRTVGAAALGVGAAGVAAVGAAAITASKDFVAFEQGMNEVFTLMPDISGAAMEEMTGQVKDLSKEFGVMPEEVVPALYQSISAGVPRENVFDFLETAQKAAAGGVTDLTTSVDGISSVVNAYGEDVVNAGEASDVMFTAVRLGKTTFEELSGSLADVNPIASALGVEFGDVGAALATMTSQGTSTNVATTQMRSLLQELSTAGTEVADVFSETAGVSFTEFIAQGNNMADAMGVIEQASADTNVPVQDMFGNVRAGMAAMQLTGSGAESFAENLGEMEGAAGATDTAFERMDGGLQATGKRLKAMAKVALLDFAEAFSPLLEMVADFAEDLMPKLGKVLDGTVIPAVEAFAGWIKTTAEAISAGGIQQLFTTFEDGSSRLGSLISLFGVGEEKAMAIGAAINNFVANVQSLLGPIMAAIGQFVSWKDVLLVLGVAIAAGIALIVGPLVLAIAKISLIVAGVIAVVAILRNAWESNWGGIQEKTAAVIKFVQNIITTVMTAVQTFWNQNGDQILAKAQQIWTAIQMAIQIAITTVQNIIQRVTAIIAQVWGQRGDEISGKAQQVWSLIQGAISTAINAVQSVITSVVSAITAFWSSNHEQIQSVTTAIWDAVGQYIEGVIDQIGFILDAFIALFTGDWEAFGEAIGNIWRNSWETTIEILGTLWDGVKPLLDSLWTNIKGFFDGIDWGQLGRAIIEGIKNGLLGAAGGLYDAVSGIVNGMLGRAQDEADSSPIAGAFVPLGESVSRGIAFGIERQQRAMEGAMVGAISSLARGRSLPMAHVERADTSRSGPQFIMNIHNNSRQEDLVGDFRLMEAMAGGI